MTLCTQCILPENYPDITFDCNGVCNYCQNYKLISYAGRKELQKIFNNHVGAAQNYDCLVPISGGRDSSFVLHEVVKRYGLKTLAFNFNNGFVTERARKNIREIVEYLKVDYVEWNYPNDTQVALFRENLELNSGKSLLHVLRDICNGCSNGYKGGALRLAAEKNIPLVIFGNSQMEESVYKKTIFTDIDPINKEKIFNMFAHPFNFLKRRQLNAVANQEYPYPDKGNYQGEIVHFFDYIEWSEADIVETIHNMGWKGEGEATWRVDCKVHVLVDYLTFKIFGYNEKDEMLSKQIREGKISRDRALEKIKGMRAGVEEDKEKIRELLTLAGINSSRIRAVFGV